MLDLLSIFAIWYNNITLGIASKRHAITKNHIWLPVRKVLNSPMNALRWNLYIGLYQKRYIYRVYLPFNIAIFLSELYWNDTRLRKITSCVNILITVVQNNMLFYTADSSISLDIQPFYKAGYLMVLSEYQLM